MKVLENWLLLYECIFKKKGLHVQFNVINAGTLREAQKHPDEYRDLVIRVAGYSAFFVDVSKEVQDDIISRTEHTFM